MFLLPMFLSHLLDTCVSACDHSTRVLDGDDGCTHGLLGVEEALLLSLLRCLLSVHCNFKNYLNYHNITLTLLAYLSGLELLWRGGRSEGRVGLGWVGIIIDD